MGSALGGGNGRQTKRKKEHSSSVPTSDDAKEMVRGRGQSEILSDEVLASPAVHDLIEDRIVNVIGNHDRIYAHFKVFDSDLPQPEIEARKQGTGKSPRLCGSEIE